MQETLRIATDQLQIAADFLRTGKTVAFPTETVYGLGADALNAQAVEKIFLAKGRPSDNPLIVHIASIAQLDGIASDISVLAKNLIERFWPGPLTIVVRRKPQVPNIVTAGLDTVAVRMPEHATARELIRLADRPIVAPSANRSGRPSATTWESVLADLDGRIDAIVCGGPTRIGLESTVVDATGTEPIILRHGAITQEMIASACGEVASGSSELQVRSPGTRHRHYQPQAKVQLVEDLLKLDPSSQRCGMIGLSEAEHRDLIETRLKNRFPQATVHLCSSLDEYASNLFEFFRQCDRLGLDRIYCQRVAHLGLGRAIMDRLQRAAE
jgi:L-threonylcarbamoyladenylate synthase